MQVIITGTHSSLGVAAFDDLSLKVSSDDGIPPVISSVPNQTIVSGETLGPLSFPVSDMDTEFNSLTISAVSSNTTLIKDENITTERSNGNGTIILISESGQTGQATITITVSDGMKAVVTSFTVTVEPNVKMDTNLVADGVGWSLNGWTNHLGHFATVKSSVTNDWVFTNTYSEEHYMYQNININKFSALVDEGYLTFTAAGDVTNNGKILLTFSDYYGTEISKAEVGSNVLIPSGTRNVRVSIGGTTGCTIDNVSFVINSTGLPKATSISDQSVYSGNGTGDIPFTVGYAGSGTVLKATSSNTEVVPESGISFGGSRYQRTIYVTPKSGIFGSSTITIYADKTPVTSFLVTAVKPISSLTVQSKSVTVNYGYTGAPTLTVIAQKDDVVGESESITYQWYDGDGTKIENATSASYTVQSDLPVGSYSYYCAVTCGWYTVNSDVITVTVQKSDTEIMIAEGYTSYTKTCGDEAFTLIGITHIGDGTLTYTSSDENIVTVDANGNVTIVGAGEATITVSLAETDNYYAAENKTITVQVTAISLSHKVLTLKAGGAAATLTAVVAPEYATGQGLTWSSDNTAVATVTGGVVTPLSQGTAVITVTTEDGNYTDSCIVTVEAPECLASYYGVQKRSNSDGTVDLRLIGIIHTLETEEVGFVYSVSDTVPVFGKAGCTSLSTNKVYSKITVKGTVKTAVELGGDGAYIIVGTVKGIGAITSDKLYVCAYVKKDGVITYSEVKELEVDILQ